MMSYYFPIELQQVSAKKISDFVYEQLEEAIILREFMPHQQLPTERELSDIFNASRMVVREALGRLEESGLIFKKVGAKGGTFVQPITLHSQFRTPEEIHNQGIHLHELFEYRGIIEPEAAYLAAEHITIEQLDQLEHYLVLNKSEDISREMFRALDVKFHLGIAKASGNSHIEKAVRMIRTKINPALDLMPFNEEIREVNLSMHYQLIKALHAHDKELAKVLMREHIEKSTAAILDKLTPTTNK